MKIVVTGGGGFIGRNLRVGLYELGYQNVVSIERSTGVEDLRAELASADFVFHLAGVNRPENVSDFDAGNRVFTAMLCDVLRSSGRKAALVYTSSTQALLDNPYGMSKRGGELEVERYASDTGAAVYLLRLPNVFGKWCRPNYNSVVATFCHNIARRIPITVNDPSAQLRLVYIDDVVETMLRFVGQPEAPTGGVDVTPAYDTTVGAVATMLREFAAIRETGIVPRVGVGLTRVLYATYVSYLPLDDFAYTLTRHLDERGVFVEMLKTSDSGQFSFFTARPGITRGGHYHHTKSEKFLVLKGRARFGFRHITTGEMHEVLVSGDESRVVETAPGWAHDITNVGDDEMIVMLWANEVFDRNRPDTIAAAVNP
ncbi:MAG: capsular biosynthesis protein [Gemmatimonadetes bacterium]|nr:capsular biosynthesis protein [Gemmatimonadota bacterium]